ncbi:hypothetical protein ABZY44_07170 [Streptomyces sp. NPDC006544]|uniref:hypothetical protein n=1 Tax=Streptomyces sp. NPDC006544 TaxID=3154583 RepID=UPI0033AE6FDE
MSLADLTFAQWRSCDPQTVRRTVREAADRVGGRVGRVEVVEHLGGPLHGAIVEREGREFALVPGGTLRLGFDPQAWEPTPDQAADYAESLAEGYGLGLGLKEYLAATLSPPRTVTLETVLMAVENETLDELPAGIPAVLAARGLRMPSADEWEHACGAGARTLFRWGDDCPLEEPSWGGTDGPRSQPNAFGLRIAYDAYAAELSADPGAVHGGDGGEAVCGGYGSLLGWLPLATANRNPSMAEFAYGPDGEDVVEAFSTRPVLSLR